MVNDLHFRFAPLPRRQALSATRAIALLRTTRLIVWTAIAVSAWPGTASARQTPADLDALLDLAGERIEEFWSQYSRVTSVEELHQTKLSPAGEVVSEAWNAYDYLMVMELVGNRPRFEESRIQRGEPGTEPEEPLLVSSGFSALLLVFHPYFRTSFDYRLEPIEPSEGSWQRIGFNAIRGQRTPSALRLGGRNYPIAWRGRAWVDRNTGRVSRIEAELADTMEDLGLHSLTARTDYRSVRLGGSALAYWLPESTIIEARSERQHWRNEHRFENYRLFSVESDLEIPEPEQGNR